jgi:hypothetical protein
METREYTTKHVVTYQQIDYEAGTPGGVVELEFDSREKAEEFICQSALSKWDDQAKTEEEGIEPEFIEDVIEPVARAIQAGEATLVIKHWHDITATSLPDVPDACEFFTLSEDDACQAKQAEIAAKEKAVSKAIEAKLEEILDLPEEGSSGSYRDYTFLGDTLDVSGCAKDELAKALQAKGFDFGSAIAENNFKVGSSLTLIGPALEAALGLLGINNYTYES